MNARERGPDAAEAEIPDGGGEHERQEAAERRERRDVAHEREVAGAEQHAVEREEDARERQHRDEPGPQHADLVVHRRDPA